LENLYQALNQYDFILTPHLDTDYPDDGLLPDDAHIMKSGIFNLGFIGLRNSQKTASFLEWWKQKLYNKCVIDHANGYFVDQKFMDIAITLFRNYFIVIDSGYNVAYWNIHSRKISRVNNEWRCNDGKLYFFHFSNFKPERKDQISGHQTRYSLNKLPDLNDLFVHYGNLLDHNGYADTVSWPYTYNYFSNGQKITYLIRKLYRKKSKSLHLDNPFNFYEHHFHYRACFILLEQLNEIRNLIKNFNFLRTLFGK
jgi:hypothetical protein